MFNIKLKNKVKELEGEVRIMRRILINQSQNEADTTEAFKEAHQRIKFLENHLGLKFVPGGIEHVDRAPEYKKLAKIKR